MSSSSVPAESARHREGPPVFEDWLVPRLHVPASLVGDDVPRLLVPANLCVRAGEFARYRWGRPVLPSVRGWHGRPGTQRAGSVPVTWYLLGKVLFVPGNPPGPASVCASNESIAR